MYIYMLYEYFGKPCMCYNHNEQQKNNIRMTFFNLFIFKASLFSSKTTNFLTILKNSKIS